MTRWNVFWSWRTQQESWSVGNYDCQSSNSMSFTTQAWNIKQLMLYLSWLHWSKTRYRYCTSPCCSSLLLPAELDHRSVASHDFICKEAKGPCFRQASSTVGLLLSTFDCERNGFLVCTAPMNWAVQTVVHTSLQPPFLYHSHYQRLAWHSDDRCMYDSMGKEYHWPHLSNEVTQIWRIT